MTSPEQANQTFADLRAKIIEAYTAEFHARPDLAGGGQHQIVFQMVYAAALLDVAAEIGIDAGMTEDMFENVMQESFRRCLRNQPRFG